MKGLDQAKAAIRRNRGAASVRAESLGEQHHPIRAEGVENPGELISEQPVGQDEPAVVRNVTVVRSLESAASALMVALKEDPRRATATARASAFAVRCCVAPAECPSTVRRPPDLE